MPTATSPQKVPGPLPWEEGVGGTTPGEGSFAAPGFSPAFGVGSCCPAQTARQPGGLPYKTIRARSARVAAGSSRHQDLHVAAALPPNKEFIALLTAERVSRQAGTSEGLSFLFGFSLLPIPYSLLPAFILFLNFLCNLSR